MWYTQNMEGRKTQEHTTYSATMDYDLKTNVQIFLSKVIKNIIILTYSMEQSLSSESNQF